MKKILCILMCLISFSASAYTVQIEQVGSCYQASYTVNQDTIPLSSCAVDSATAKAEALTLLEQKNTYATQTKSFTHSKSVAYSGDPDATATIDGVLYNFYYIGSERFYIPAASVTTEAAEAEADSQLAYGAAVFWQDLYNAVNIL